MSRADEITTDFCVNRIPLCVLRDIPSRALKHSFLGEVLACAFFVATLAVVLVTL